YLASLAFVICSKKFSTLQRTLSFIIFITYLGHSLLNPIQRYTLYVVILNAMLAYQLYGKPLDGWVRRMGYALLILFLGLNVFTSYTSKVQTDTYSDLSSWVRTQ